MPGVDIYWTAYHELQSDRHQGMALGPIPWSSIVRWAELNGLGDVHDISVLTRYIRAMESADREIDEAEKVAK